MAVKIVQERIDGAKLSVVELTVGDFDPEYKDELKSYRINSHQLENLQEAIRLWLFDRGDRLPEVIEISDDGKHTIITKEFGT